MTWRSHAASGFTVSSSLQMKTCAGKVLPGTVTASRDGGGLLWVTLGVFRAQVTPLCLPRGFGLLCGTCRAGDPGLSSPHQCLLPDSVPTRTNLCHSMARLPPILCVEIKLSNSQGRVLKSAVYPPRRRAERGEDSEFSYHALSL